MTNNTTLNLDIKLDELSKEIIIKAKTIKEFKDIKISSDEKLEMLDTSTILWRKVYYILEDIDKLKFSNKIEEYESYSKKIKSLYNKLKKFEDDLVYDKV